MYDNSTVYVCVYYTVKGEKSMKDIFRMKNFRKKAAAAAVIEYWVVWCSGGEELRGPLC